MKDESEVVSDLDSSFLLHPSSFRKGGSAGKITAMLTTAASLLLQLPQPQNHGAWQRFIELYSPLLYHWLRGSGLQPADSADLVQEVFVSVLSHVPQFDRQRLGSFRAW